MFNVQLRFFATLSGRNGDGMPIDFRTVPEQSPLPFSRSAPELQRIPGGSHFPFVH